MGSPRIFALILVVLAATPAATRAIEPVGGFAAPPLTLVEPTLREKLSPDKLVLVDGAEIRGKLLEVNRQRVRILVDLEETAIRRNVIEEIDRGLAAKRRSYLAKRIKEIENDPSAEAWRKFANFCLKEEAKRGWNLAPERNRALDRLLKEKSDDAKAREEKDYAFHHDGTWWAIGILADYKLEGGSLVARDEAKKSSTEKKGAGEKDGGSGTSTVVKKAGPHPKSYRLLERKEMSPRKLRELEESIAEMVKNAEKAREKQDLEYEGVEWEDRYKIPTRHFEVHCNSTRRIAVLYSRLMEAIRAELAKRFKSPIVRNLRAPVFIYKSQEEFMEQDRLGRWAGRGVGGYYMPVNQQVVAFHGTFGFTGTTFSVLCHEGTHYFQGLVLKGGFDNVPIWLIEGLAVYFGDGSTFDPKRVKIETGKIPRDRLVHIQEKMEGGYHTPVEKLIAMKRGWGGFSGSHYADSWALIYYMVHSGKKGQQFLNEYWKIGIERLLKKKDFRTLAEKHYGSIKELEKEYVKYILGLQVPSAGEVKGDYFMSDVFRFFVKSPGSEWRFFEDGEDKSMVVGTLLPDTSAEVRIYFRNNMENQESEDYMKSYVESRRERFGRVRTREVTISGLPATELRYVHDGKEQGPSTRVVFVDGKIKQIKRPKKKSRGPREVTEYVLVQIDGVAVIECSAAQGEGRKFREHYDGVRASFTLDNSTRRW